MKTLNYFSFLLFLAVFGLLVGCTQSKKADQAEEQAEEAVAEDNGWITLFDGTSTEGWRGYQKDSLPPAWSIVEGTLYIRGSGRGEAGAEDGGDIIYDKKYKNFHLKLSWKISEGGNSGIFYLGQELPEFEAIWQTAPEMQILDNERHIDAQLGKDGNHKAGSLYDLIPAVPQNTKPAGEWNDVEIMVYEGTVIHRQNGEQVVEYHLWTPKWDEMIANSKFPEYNENWAQVASEGYIGLQDHGNDCWFKDIKIKEL